MVDAPWHSENQVVALWPHLHARGTHVSMLIAPGASAPQTVIDAPYAIDHQPIIPAALALHPGDNVGVTCTYVNNTQTNPLVFGDSPRSVRAVLRGHVRLALGGAECFRLREQLT